MHIRRKKLFINYIALFLILVIVCPLLAGCGASSEEVSYSLPEEQKLVVYTSHKQEIYEPIIKEFQERTGIWVEVISGGTKEMLDRIAQEADFPACDIMFGGGVDSLCSYTDYFAPYSSDVQEKLDPTYRDASDRYTVFSNLPIVFIYNKKLVFSAGKPRTWQELLTSTWKDKISFADPSRSGSAYTALCTLITARADALSQAETLELFASNLRSAGCASSSSQVLEDVIAGTRLIGITTEDAALKRIHKGADIGIIYPTDGTSVIPDGTAIIKNAPHAENARLFLEFTVSEDAQKLLREKCYRRPVRLDLEEDDAITELTYDLSWSATEQASILGTFEKALGKEGN
ncbi:MAG: ABC transporter substrate-binding protein [Lachnospiraceae bacterium]|nr:ABC transporter substrate-binding protein [Lachnospiraceae bacterium]